MLGDRGLSDWRDGSLREDRGLGCHFFLFVVVLQGQEQRIVRVSPEGEGVRAARQEAVFAHEPVVALVQASPQFDQRLIRS